MMHTTLYSHSGQGIRAGLSRGHFSAAMRAAADQRAAAAVEICGCPIWYLLFVPARCGAQFRGRLLGPRDFSLPLTG
eukprot:6807202-Prymnesium_polylepis.1